MQSSVSYPWKEFYDEVFFRVTFKVLEGKEWVDSLKKRDIGVGESAYDLLVPKKLFSTEGKKGIKSKIILLRGSQLCGVGNKISVWKILVGASKRGLIHPNPEIACLICQNFTSKDIRQMGFDVVYIMHSSIVDSEEDRMRFVVNAHGEDLFLNASMEKEWTQRTDKIGFAFEVPE
ncbi:MAG: hypothetical protein NDI62_01960 [Burkholderiales bacterium]|nr:hypothetical protein [Burkholderiales bacterium]